MCWATSLFRLHSLSYTNHRQQPFIKLFCHSRRWGWMAFTRDGKWKLRTCRQSMVNLLELGQRHEMWKEEGKCSIRACLLTQVTLLSGFCRDIWYCDISLLTFGWFMYHSFSFQNNSEKMQKNLLLVKTSHHLQECLPFLEGKVPATISISHPVTPSACLVSPLKKGCTASTKILFSTESSCTAENCNKCLLRQTTSLCSVVFFFNTEKTDAIWQVHVSENTFFSSFLLLGMPEGFSLLIASSIHKYVLFLFQSADNICSKFQNIIGQGKKKSFLLLILSWSSTNLIR